jgi:hypothetical protein
VDFVKVFLSTGMGQESMQPSTQSLTLEALYASKPLPPPPITDSRERHEAMEAYAAQMRAWSAKVKAASKVKAAVPAAAPAVLAVAKVFPFGKHRRQPIEVVLEDENRLFIVLCAPLLLAV